MSALIPGSRPYAQVDVLRRERAQAIASTVLFVGLMVAATGLRFWHLGARDLFRDEAASWLLARYPWDTLLARIGTEPYPPLYPFLLKEWMALVGDGAAALRAISALAGIVTVWLTWHLARAAIGRAQALVAAAFVAISPVALTEAREVRMYAFETLFATLAWWSIWHVSTDRTPGRRGMLIALTAVSVAGELWTLPTGIAMLGLQIVVVGWSVVRGGAGAHGARAAALGIALGTLSFVPWIPHLLQAALATSPAWTQPGGLGSLAVAAGTLLAGFLVTPASYAAPLAGAAAVGGLVVLFRRRGPAERLTARTVLAGMGLVLAWWLVSLVRSAYDARYLGSAVPFIGMAVGAGLTAAWGRVSRTPWSWASRTMAVGVLATGCAAVASGTVVFSADWLTNTDVAPARAVVAELGRVMRPGDVALVVDPRSYFPVAYEASESARHLRAGENLWYWRGEPGPAYFGAGLIGPELSIPASSTRDNELAIPGLAAGGSVWVVAITTGTAELDAFTPLVRHRLGVVNRIEVPGRGMDGLIVQLRPVAARGS